MELNVISTDGSIINDIKNSTKDFKVEAKLLTQEKNQSYSQIKIVNTSYKIIRRTNTKHFS
jgi:TusA-related sulfurtransferase